MVWEYITAFYNWVASFFREDPDVVELVTIVNETRPVRFIPVNFKRRRLDFAPRDISPRVPVLSPDTVDALDGLRLRHFSSS